MHKNEKFLKAYYARVSALLLCSGKAKRTIMTELRGNVADYLSENGNARPEDILSVFGTPEEIAASALQGADTAALKQKIMFKRAVLIALLLALLIWAAFAVAGLIDVHTEAHGSFEEGLLCISAGGGLPL